MSMLRQAKVYNRHPKPMWKSRTMWFSLSLVIIGSLYENFSYLQNIIPPKYYGIIFIAIGIICVILRFVTSQPMRR
jgi:hypothetical protein